MNSQTTPEKSRRHDPMESLLDHFFHSPVNQSVFRYSEIQQSLKKMGKEDTRKFIDDDLPAILETADKLLSMQNVRTTKTISKKKTTSQKFVSIKLKLRDGTNEKKKQSKPKRNTTVYKKQMKNMSARRMRSYKKHYANKEESPLIRKHRKKYLTFSPVRYTKASRITFDALNFWVRDSRLEKKWATAQYRGAKTRKFVSENYLNKLTRNGSRDSNEIQGSYNALRSSSRASRKVHSLEHNSNIRCRPSAESFEECYSNYRARYRRIPQMMRAIAPSTDVINKTSNITKPVVRARNVVEAKRSGAKEEEETKKEKKLPEDLNPYDILHQIIEKLTPAHKNYANMTVEVLGRTLEYKDIVMIKATALPKKVFRAQEDKYDKSVPDKKIVLIVHGLAAMGLKYVPCLSTVEGLKTLMSYYYEHLDQFDIYIIPMANPDGAALWMKNIWNKNASPQSACPGVAVDRNFDVGWKDSQHTVSSCQQQYPGPEPFSELESRAVRDVLHKYSHRIIGYFHVHVSSHSADIFKGDAALYPKGYTDFASDDDKYVDIKAEIDDVMKNASFKVYSFTTDSLYNWYGKVSGTSVDYAASVYGIPFSMELVMQLYDDDEMVEESEERETVIVLTEVWHRVVDVIFKFMYKTQNNTEKK